MTSPDDPLLTGFELRGLNLRNRIVMSPMTRGFSPGGVPGRNEIDDTQELHYPAIMNAIVGTGFKGHVAQEFIPKRADVLASLRQGVNICDV